MNMLISARSLKGKHVFLGDKETPVARVRGVIIAGDTGQVLGFKVGISKVIGFGDLNWDEQNGLFYVRDSDSVCDANEIVRLKMALKSGNYFNKQRVVSETFKKIGKLHDVMFDPVLGILGEIIAVKRFLIWTSETVISRINILDVDSKEIKVRGNGSKVMSITPELKNKAAPMTGTALSDLLTN